VKAWAVLAALFLSALALRPQLVGVGPILPEIGEDLDVSHAVAGLLGTIPVLCMGVFAPPAAYVAARIGTRGAIGACLAAIAVFGLLRAAAPGAPLVLALTLPIGVGMGLAGALMPVAVKERFAHRPAFASGVYTTGINMGSALSSAVAVPLAAALGGWRGALAVFSACTILCFAAWLVLTPPVRERVQPRPPRMPWGRGVVWALAAVFALQSIVYYGLVAWMPDSFQERGWSAGAAGALVGALGIATLPGGGWAWAALAGLGIGASFPMTLTLPLDVGREPAETGAVVGLMLGAGYTITALGPLALGAARDLTGSFSTSLWVLVGVAAAFLVSVLPLSPDRLSPPRRLEPEVLAR
jgi:CP family cyanate transporter-like MFS transporter